MLSQYASKILSPSQKRRLKPIVRKLKIEYIRTFRTYNSNQFLSALSGIGIGQNDTLIVHGSYSPYNGFAQSPVRIVSALREAIGPGGTLLMPSSPYTTSTEEYFQSKDSFDVNRTASQMGILSEIFRRSRGTLRSLNPAHPILASGPLASWFIAGHENCVHSCGPGSPFEKLVEKDAKVLFFDTTIFHMMFLHFLEHTVKDDLPFPLYKSEICEKLIIDDKQQNKSVAVYPFTKEARTRRRFSILEAELRRRNVVSSVKVGNTSLTLLGVIDSLEATRDLANEGRYFYDLNPKL